MNCDTTIVMNKTSANVPMNSAMYAEVPRSAGWGTVVRQPLDPPAGRWRAAVYGRAALPVTVRRRCGRFLVLIGRRARPRRLRRRRRRSAGTPPSVTVGLDFTPNAAHAGIYAAVSDGRATRTTACASEIRAAGGRQSRLAEAARDAARRHRRARHPRPRPRAREGRRTSSAVGRARAAAARRGDRARGPRLDAAARAGGPSRRRRRACRRTTPSCARWSRTTAATSTQVDRVTIGFGAVANLLAGKVDAATAFWNAEGVVLRERGARDARVPRRRLRRAALPGGGPRRPPRHARGAPRRRRRGGPGDRRRAPRTRSPTATRRSSEIAAASESDEDLVRAQVEAVAPAHDAAARPATAARSRAGRGSTPSSGSSSSRSTSTARSCSTSSHSGLMRRP